MKNILVVVPDDRLGGAEQFLKNISIYHLEQGNQLYIVFLKRKQTGSWDDLRGIGNVQYFFTDSNSELRGLIPTFINFRKLRKLKFDLVFSSHLHLNSFIGFLVKFKIIKKQYFVGRESTSVFLRYSGKQLLLFKTLYRLGYSSVDLLISQTDFMKEQLIEGLPWLAKKTNIQVIPNPINLRSIRNTQLSSEKIHPREFIVSAGRLIPEKGYDILIEAFKGVATEHPNLDLLILGEGHKRRELEKQIEVLNLKNRVFLKGHVGNVYDYFNQALVCVVASRVEGFPNVLLQMMSQNNNVVSTNCAGNMDHLLGVLLANSNDTCHLRKKIKQAVLNVNTENNIFQKQLEDRSLESFNEQIETYLVEKK